jgi:hypothetical protein
MPKLLINITDEQAAWLDKRCSRLDPKGRLIRELIAKAMAEQPKPKKEAL